MAITLQRLSLPHASGAVLVHDRCFDRIRVQVDGELSANVGDDDAPVLMPFFDTAIRECNLFLDHCRVAARTPFVTGIERNYRIEDGRFYVLTPYTVALFNTVTHQPLPIFPNKVNAMCSSGAVRSPETGTASMAAIWQGFREGDPPPVPQSLLIDAEERVRTLRLREAIIAMATACEIASDGYLQRTGRGGDKAVEKLSKTDASFAEKRLHSIPLLLSSRSLKLEAQATFDLAEAMYRTRNNLAHRNALEYRDVNRIAMAVDQALATRLLVASEEAVAWLDAL